MREEFHNSEDLYSIERVELENNNMMVTLKSLKNGEYEVSVFYLHGKLICDQYRGLDGIIDEILSSNEVQGLYLVDQDWTRAFKDIRAKISEHQDNCEYGCETCNVFKGLKLTHLDDDEYEIEFQAYLVGRDDIDTFATLKLDSCGVFHLGLDYLKEYADLIQKFGWEYEHMDRDLYYHVASKFGDLDAICMHEELLTDYRAEIEVVIEFGREVSTHSSISDKERKEFSDLEEYITS